MTRCACGTKLRAENRKRGICDRCQAKVDARTPEPAVRPVSWGRRRPGPKPGAHLAGRVGLPGLNAARKAASITKADLAYAVGASESAMADWLYLGGGVRPEMVGALAEVLGVSVEELTKP